MASVGKTAAAEAADAGEAQRRAGSDATGVRQHGGLGIVGIIVLISLLSMVAQLSSDLYMPALPSITAGLQTTQALTSHTITVFFLFMAIGTLVLGPTSDKFGRKPVLLVCGLVAMLSCAACALAPNIETMLALRALQGVGSGGLVSLATTLAKDCFIGDRMAQVIGITQAISMIAPIVAPLAGAAILQLAGWRMDFVVLAVLLAVCFIMICVLKETLPEGERVSGSVLSSFSGLGSLLRQRRFVLTLLAGSLFIVPFMAYIGTASYVYEDYFGLSATMFSIIFAVTALASIAGPLVFARLAAHIDEGRVMWVALAASALSCVVLLVLGGRFPLAFMLGIMLYIFFATIVRPMLTNALLAPLTEGAGAASALINFAFVAIGCLGIVFGSAGWGSIVTGIQVVMVGALVLSALLWLLASRQPKPLDELGTVKVEVRSHK